jgi:hypothetical protein
MTPRFPRLHFVFSSIHAEKREIHGSGTGKHRDRVFAAQVFATQALVAQTKEMV